MHILVLKGGVSPEREISLVTGGAVEEALKRLSYKVSSIDVKEDIIQKLAALRDVDLVFLALHGKYGEDGCIQGVLEIMGIPYTHSGLIASAAFMDKYISKHIFSYLGIDVPFGYIIDKNSILSKKVLLEKPYIVKPIDSGSSADLFYFENEHNFTNSNYPFKGEIMVEEYINGRELNVAIMCNKAIGVVEIIIPEDKKVYDYHTKYTPGLAKHVIPAEVPQNVYQKVLEYALKAHNFFKCKGITRSDFIYDEINDRIVMLEINTNPGLTPNSLVPKIALKCMNIEFDELIEIIVNDAIKN